MKPPPKPWQYHALKVLQAIGIFLMLVGLVALGFGAMDSLLQFYEGF